MLFGAAVPTFLLMYEDGRVIELSVFALGSSAAFTTLKNFLFEQV